MTVLALGGLKIKFPYNVGYVNSLPLFHAGFMHCGEGEVPGLRFHHQC